MHGFGTYGTDRALRNHLEECKSHVGMDDDDDGNTMVSDDLEETIMEAERGKFHGWVILSCSSVGSKARQQQFYVTFAAKYHGLSNYGIQMLAHHGYTQSLTSYQAMAETMLAKGRQEMRYVHVTG